MTLVRLLDIRRNCNFYKVDTELEKWIFIKETIYIKDIHGICIDNQWELREIKEYINKR